MSDEGLRARKQRQTRDAIHRAAVALALEHGPEGATVAAISDRADISARTFFNYYPSKEDAIVGLHEGLPSDAELDDFRESDNDLIGDILQLLLGLFSPDDDALMHQRRALITEHPHLVQRQWTRLLGVEQRTARVVADRMRASGAFDHLELDDAAMALVVTCSSVLRLGIRKSLDAGTYPTDVPARIDDMLHTLREVLRILP